MRPALDAAGVKLYLVSIGTPEKARCGRELHPGRQLGSRAAGPQPGAQRCCCSDARSRSGGAPGRSAAAPRLSLALLLDPRPPVASSATATCRPQGLEFAAGTGFPADRLLADVDNAAYEALAFKRGLRCVSFAPGCGCRAASVLLMLCLAEDHQACEALAFKRGLR